jgi:septum formation protein
MVQLIASGKMDAILAQLPPSPAAVVITSDQVIVVDGTVREKPENAEQARRFLASYSAGQPAECFVGVVVHSTATGQRVTACAKATQWFKPIPADAVERLIEQGDVLWCAGGFCVEHMEEFELKRDGEIETVRGLPKTLTLDLLAQVGFVPPPAAQAQPSEGNV